MNSNQLLVIDFETMQRSASALQKSGYFRDVTSEAQAVVKVMAGAELGLPPFASMSGIHIIQGKPVLGSNIMATLVKNDPRYDYRIDKCDNSKCVISWYENGHKVGESSFTSDEAQKIGLMSKDNWKNYTSDMLFARAISRGARRYAPGIFGGSPVYTPDEMNADLDEDGYVTGEVIGSEEEKEWTNESIGKETAMAATGIGGKHYWSMTSEELENGIASIDEAIAEGKLDENKKEAALYKRAVINAILEYRA